jgi:hypothetical protein
LWLFAFVKQFLIGGPPRNKAQSLLHSGLSQALYLNGIKDFEFKGYKTATQQQAKLDERYAIEVPL